VATSERPKRLWATLAVIQVQKAARARQNR
jgi:hypothetical protein